MSRTLLFAPDGRTPVATERFVSEAAEELLIQSWGVASGVAVARAKNPQEAAALFEALKMSILKGVLEIEGLRKRIEDRYDITVYPATDGGLVIRSRPPQSNPYA